MPGTWGNRLSDIFLSYNREDSDTARRFAEGLEREGFSVWWDQTLRSGEAYDEVTEAALKAAKAVVVLWSPRSVVSRWVRAEATIADRNKTLVPVMIEACERPIMFELTQTAELGHWHGEASDKAWLGFLADVRIFVAKGGAAALVAAMATPTQASPAGNQRGTRPSIAILPFTNRSDERADGVFAGGMGEDIAAALALGHGLTVISQSATFAYRKNTSDLRTIGQELGAKYLLEGNVRRVEATLRVTAQLVEAENGAILWTQKFDRPLDELAKLQEQLVEEVAAHLGVQIQKVEMERALRKPSDITAWEAVMRSSAAYARITPESLEVAVTEARRAVSLAPDYAVAQGTLAMALAMLYLTTGSRNGKLRIEAIEHAEVALKLNPDNASVLFQVSTTFTHAGRWMEALSLATRAVELNPSLIGARQALAVSLTHFERYDEALVQLAEGDRIAPRAFQQNLALLHRSWALYGLGRVEDAFDATSKYLLVHPTGSYSLISCTVFLAVLGRTTEAADMMHRTRKTAQGEPLEFWVSLIRGSWMSESLFTSFAQHFIDVWNTTPVEPEGA